MFWLLGLVAPQNAISIWHKSTKYLTPKVKDLSPPATENMGKRRNKIVANVSGLSFVVPDNQFN